MKRIWFTTLAASIIIIFNSCKKDNNQYIPGTGNSSSPSVISETNSMIIVASNWTRQADGDYLNNFAGILHQPGYFKQISRVYLSNPAREQLDLISSGTVKYMGGELWSTIDGTDLKIFYRKPNEAIPFDSLYMKIIYR